MAGETVKSDAICLDIRPWSRTSHVVLWLTPAGKVLTVVKGAVRPKSFFLGQYDLNYTCEMIYYARARGEVHVLRECRPVRPRDFLRQDFRKLALAAHFRRLASDFAPQGGECAGWYELLGAALDSLEAAGSLVVKLLAFELKTLNLLGLSPELEAESGAFCLRGERRIPVSPEVAKCLRNPEAGIKNLQIPLDAARVIGVFYQSHLDCAFDVRRTVLGMISETKEG